MSHASGASDAPSPQPIHEVIASWLKIIGGTTTLLGLVIGITLYFSSQDKRISLLESRASAQDITNQQNSAGIADLARLYTQMDKRIALIMARLGIPEPADFTKQ